MKKTQFKDTRRNIRKELISYLSIMLIAMLAVAAYLGINFASHALYQNADRFFKQHNYRDIEITSTMLLTEEDITALRNTEGVEDAEGIYAAAGTMAFKNGHANVNVVSLSDRYNTAELKEGALPQNPNECVLEKEMMDNLHLSIGDTITITDSKGETLSYLDGTEYTITGSVLHPDHLAWTTYVPGDRYVLVQKEAFDTKTLEGCYMKAELRIAGTENLSRFSKEYKELVKSTQDKLEPLNDSLAKQRENVVRSKMQSKIDDGQQKLDDAKKQLADGRKELDENAKKLEDGQKRLVDARKKIKDGRKQLKKGEKELADSLKKLEDAKAQLDDGKRQLDDGKAQLDAAYAELQKGENKLAKGKKELDKGKRKLDKANAKLVNAYNEAEDKKAEVRNLIKDTTAAVIGKKQARKINWAPMQKINDAGAKDLSISDFAILTDFSFDLSTDVEAEAKRALKRALRLIGEEKQYSKVIAEIENNSGFQELSSMYHSMLDKLKQWNDGHKEYRKGLAAYSEKEGEYQAGLAKYQESLAQYQAGYAQWEEKNRTYQQGLAEYNEGLKKYEEGKAQYEEKLAEFNKGREDYKKGKQELKDGRKKLADGEKEYAEKKAEYEEKVLELEDARKQLAELPACYFVMLDNNGNGGFAHIDISANNLGKLGISFAILFIIVGALVIYVTIGRIIGEQRTLVGAQKALGFFNSEVFKKYLIFGLSATVIGMLLGTLVGYSIIQSICVTAHAKFYILETMTNAFSPLPFVIVLAAGIVLSLLSVWWACTNLLKQTARDLLQPEMPKGSKKKTSKKAAASGSSLYSRLITRNMLTDWKRVLITMISIAGCCSLLVIGFMLRNSIVDAISIQFDRIMNYEYTVKFNSEVSETAEEDIIAALSKEGLTGLSLYTNEYSLDNGDNMTLGNLIVGNLEEISNYYKLDPLDKSGKQPFATDGLLLPAAFSTAYGFRTGDEFTIYDLDMTPRKTTISGVYYNYLGRNLFLSKEAYKNAFGGKEIKNNTIWLNSGKSKEELTNLLSGVKGFTSVKDKNDDRTVFSSLAKILSIVTLVMIVAAGLMAYFVLLNLINMYLNKKKRELVVMRINGFQTKEVIRYVAMENLVTTIAGIILGFVFGTLLGTFIIRNLESPNAGFVHGINAPALVLGALITLVFAAAINVIALRKVKNLKLTDI